MAISVNKQAVYEAAEKLRNWGRWGRDDQIGTLNHVTPKDIVEAAGLIRRGQSFALGIPLDRNGPQTGLFGDQYLWSVLGAGRNQMFVAAMSAVMGGNVRVGLEDSLWLGRGTLAKSNAEQVTKIRRILEELGLQIATPDEAREMLKLKGGRNVAF